MDEDEQEVARLDALIEGDPDTPELYVLRGIAIQFTDRENRLAIVDFDRSLKLKPGQPDALYWRGVAKEMLGDLDGAQQDFAMSQALKPPYAGGED